MVPDPNRSAIERHIELLVSPWRDHLDAKIEFRALKRDAKPVCWLSDADPDSLEVAVDKVLELNDAGSARNVYVTINPVSSELAHTSAKDVDIVAAYFAFADADNGEASKRLRFAKPVPSFFVQTGTIPENRLHAYWQIDGTTDLVTWRQLQRNIQTHLDTDDVSNPVRILRLAGTVSWPAPHKVLRGYVPELTRLVEDFA